MWCPELQARGSYAPPRLCLAPLCKSQRLAVQQGSCAIGRSGRRLRGRGATDGDGIACRKRLRQRLVKSRFDLGSSRMRTPVTTGWHLPDLVWLRAGTTLYTQLCL